MRKEQDGEGEESTKVLEEVEDVSELDLEDLELPVRTTTKKRDQESAAILRETCGRKSRRKGTHRHSNRSYSSQSESVC